MPKQTNNEHEALILMQSHRAREKFQAQGILANIVAEEKNQSSLIEKVSTEKQRFEEEYEKWQGLIQSNSSIQKRLDYSRFEQYIKEAQKSMGLLKWSNHG